MEEVPPDGAFRIVRFEDSEGVPHARALPELPEGADGIWETFWALSRHRVERNSLSPSIVADWLRMHGRRLSTLESGVIDAMDRTYLEALGKQIALNKARRDASAKE